MDKNDDGDHLTESLITRAAKCISKGQTKNKQNKPLIDEDFQEAIAFLRATLRKFSKRSAHNVIEQLRARDRRSIKGAEKVFEKYVKNLNSYSKNKAWEMIRIINHPEIGNDKITTKVEITNLLFEIYSENSKAVGNKRF